jgi:hypothetical protein
MPAANVGAQTTAAKAKAAKRVRFMMNILETKDEEKFD